jgi:tRNA(fMet)-specific endonuclease VapC
LRFERLAFDTGAAIDFLRPERLDPSIDIDVGILVLPLFVLAELELGVSRSTRKEENLRRVRDFVADCSLLAPDEGTIVPYVRLRDSFEAARTLPRASAKLEGLNNDLWIAALCLQHRLPLLTNDKDFDGIDGLELIHW